MKVNGTVISSLSDFIGGRFGAHGRLMWLESLAPRSRAIYSGPVAPTKWYPMREALSLPLSRMAEIFFEGDAHGARESGGHRAQAVLGGTAVSPATVIKRAERMFSTCYTPTVAQAAIISPGNGMVRLTYFSELDPLIEARLIGFVERGLELCGAEDVGVGITSSIAQGRPYSEYHFSWR